MSAGNSYWIKAIHIARQKVGIDDEAYRALLSGAAGVDSSMAVVTVEQYHAVMQAFKELGYVPAVGLYQQRWGCSIAQQSTILALWKVVGKHQEQTALTAFVKRIAHVGTPRFLTTQLAQYVIIALEKMEEDFNKGSNNAVRK